MRLLALLAAGLFAGAVMADDKKDEKKVKDEEAILGTWKVENVDEGAGRGRRRMRSPRCGWCSRRMANW